MRVFGRQLFMGYLYDEERTRMAIDDDGWLHTGDIGRIDSDGYLFIKGRMKGNSDQLFLPWCKAWVKT